MTDAPRFLLVRLEPDLHPSRVAVIWANLRLLPGVESVADAAIVSRETLDAVLLKPEAQPVAKPKRRKAKAA